MAASPSPVPAPARHGSLRNRFETALDAARASGVRIALNVMTCCKNCATYADMGLPAGSAGTPLAWHFGGQGLELAWIDDDRPVYLEEPDERECECDDLYDGNEESGECEVCQSRYVETEPHRPADSLAFRFEPDVSVACRVRDAFAGQGFDVDWDGSMDQALTVRLA